VAGAAEYIPVLIRKDLLKLSLQEAFLLIGLQMSATYLRIMPVTPLFGFLRKMSERRFFRGFNWGCTAFIWLPLEVWVAFCTGCRQMDGDKRNMDILQING